MKFWTDKEGNKLSGKEFLTRWKSGLRSITPMQQVKSQIWSIRIVIIGLLCGIVICLLGLENLWWLCIILVGGLFNSVIQYLGLWQKKKLYEDYQVDIPEDERRNN